MSEHSSKEPVLAGLRRINAIGGLGYDAHDVIRAAIEHVHKLEVQNAKLKKACDEYSEAEILQERRSSEPLAGSPAAWLVENTINDNGVKEPYVFVSEKAAKGMHRDLLENGWLKVTIDALYKRCSSETTDSRCDDSDGCPYKDNRCREYCFQKHHYQQPKNTEGSCYDDVFDHPDYPHYPKSE